MRKNFTLFLAALLCSYFSFAQVQQLQPLQQTSNNRCGTMIAIEKAKKANPQYFAELERKAKEAEKNLLARTATLTSPVTIPVVVHVVYSTPDLVTEEQVDYLLNRLNLDYSGLNPDSTNASSYYSVRGHSQIRFTRARRDPSGNLTNGLEKRVGTVGISANTYQPLKHSSEGGLDPWDVTKYYNIWVGADASGIGLLGIAPSIGPGNATETISSAVGIDGVCINIACFSNACYAYAQYNLGRTAVHEIGHNFGLFHTFSGCSAGADFAQLESGQTLPSNLLTASDDTPNQGTETSGCPSGSSTSDCGGNKMYQNYMDYTDDACMTMFTKGQVARMEYVLENFRSGYLTSNGATPPASYPSLDVSANAVISPGGIEFNNTTCTITTYPTPICPSNFTPKLQIKNLGSSTITSITATITVNGTPSTQTFTGLNVLTFGTTVLTFTSKSLVDGANTVQYAVSLPNGGTDQVSGNNTISQTITLSTTNAPVNEGFEGTTYPTSGWSLSASANSYNWEKTTSAAKTGSASIKAAFYDAPNGDEFSLITNRLYVIYNMSANLKFDYAYRLYNTSTLGDSLEVLVSNNCGSSWTSLWKSGGNAMKTVSTATTASFTPTSTQWATSPASINMNSYLGQSILLKFRAKSGYGNNLYVDNIVLDGTSNTPMQFISFKGFVNADKNIQLNFKTANEVNCESFIIEKSVNAINFQEIGKLSAKNGAENLYDFLDIKPFSTINYYRIKQVDKDGKFIYSNIISLSTTKATINTVSLYPNPTKDKVTLNINAINAEEATIKLLDALGKTIVLQKASLVRGNQAITLNTQNLQSGVYTIVVAFANETITQKLIKQ